MPTTKGFFPMGNPNCNTAVILTIDEYEAIRLIDKLGYSQEECGNYMQVARTTVQMIYNMPLQRRRQSVKEWPRPER